MKGEKKKKENNREKEPKSPESERERVCDVERDKVREIEYDKVVKGSRGLAQVTFFFHHLLLKQTPQVLSTLLKYLAIRVLFYVLVLRLQEEEEDVGNLFIVVFCYVTFFFKEKCLKEWRK